LKETIKGYNYNNSSALGIQIIDEKYFIGKESDDIFKTKIKL
jgi:hypothetical protein